MNQLPGVHGKSLRFDIRAAVQQWLAGHAQPPGPGRDPEFTCLVRRRVQARKVLTAGERNPGIKKLCGAGFTPGCRTCSGNGCDDGKPPLMPVPVTGAAGMLP